MIPALQSYVLQGHHRIKKWVYLPKVHFLLRAAAHIGVGFALSAASLGNACQPIASAFVSACSGWSGILCAVGSCVGYRLFWGVSGHQGLLWTVLSLAVSILLENRRSEKGIHLLLPMASALICAANGLLFQMWFQDTTPIPIYILRVGMAAGCSWLFSRVLQGRNPITDWLTCGVAVLALAQIVLPPSFSLGFFAAATLAVVGSFPACALSGLALDLACITPVPMTAVLCGCYLFRFLPRCPKALSLLAPVSLYIVISNLCQCWDFTPVFPILAGGLAGGFLPSPTRIAHRRGETGTVQVRLEMSAAVLAQTEQILLEVPLIPIDEGALIHRAAERACNGCPCRRGCKDACRIGQLPAALLHKPLLSSQELPIICRKSGRFLAELHRAQEQLRSIRADRERQQEYRAAVVQQYRFLSSYLQDLSDQLSSHTDTAPQAFRPVVQVFGNREGDLNGDRILKFSGTQNRYYILLCDGMGTGPGAVMEGKTAANLLRRLLVAGFPSQYALRSLNSLCALRERPGAATVDLAELHLGLGKLVLYKWGANVSFLVSRQGIQKLGVAGPPPGLSVTDCQESTLQVSLRRGERLVMLSDGIGQDEAMQCCLKHADAPPQQLVDALLECARCGGQDDASVALISLESL